MKLKKKVILFFGVIALCKFGHRKFDISKIIIAMSFKLGQVIVDNEKIIKILKKVICPLQIWSLKTCHQDISKIIVARNFNHGQLVDYE